MNKNKTDLETDGVNILFQDVVLKVNNSKIFDGLSCSLDKNLITVFFLSFGVLAFSRCPHFDFFRTFEDFFL